MHIWVCARAAWEESPYSTNAKQWFIEVGSRSSRLFLSCYFRSPLDWSLSVSHCRPPLSSHRATFKTLHLCPASVSIFVRLIQSCCGSCIAIVLCTLLFRLCFYFSIFLFRFLFSESIQFKVIFAILVVVLIVLQWFPERAMFLCSISFSAKLSDPETLDIFPIIIIFFRFSLLLSISLNVPLCVSFFLIPNATFAQLC